MKKVRESKQILQWLYSIVKKNIKNIVILCFLQMFIGISSVFTALALRALINCAIEKNVGGFGKNSFLFAGILILQIAVRAGIRYLEECTRSDIENAGKHRVFRALLNGDYAAVSSKHSEEWMNRLTSDTVVVADGMVQIFPGLLSMIVRITGALIAIFILEVRLAYLLIPGAVMLIFTTYGFRKVLKNMHRRIQETDGKLRVFMQEHLGNLVIVKTFAKEESSLLKADAKMEEHKCARMRRNHFSNVCNVGFAAAMNGVYFLGALLCGYGILKGTISYGTFVAITELIGQVQNPLANISGYLPKYYAMLASAERLMEIEEFSSDSLERKTDEEIAGFYKEKFKEIGFSRVSFTYRNGGALSVLNNFSLAVKKGEYVAFTGESGCGKSTLLKLLMCLYPLNAGKRYLKINADELIELDASWRGLFAYVPQGNQLMSGTIREIVSFSNTYDEQKEQKLVWALKIACADEFVNTLEKGVDTVLNERGQGLSEGQMQRIAIARAIFSEHPILLLDEATSALDEVTEEKVLHNLKTMTDKTVLIVTHRMAVLDICDKQVHLTEESL